MKETDENHSEDQKKGFFEKIKEQLFHETPENRKELLEVLHDSCEQKLFNSDALHMIEGVLRVSELRADDIMIPRAQMKVIDVSDDPKEWVRIAINSGHSRFPAIDGDRDNIVGILLAKDMLRLFDNPEYKVLDHLKEAVFVPESKPVDILLKEFRMKRNHMALVVDEFGSISGLITIEDVLEEIVGEIDDEFDQDENAGNIVKVSPGKWRVKAKTHIEDFNGVFQTNFSDDHYESIGGLISDALEHVPHVGEVVDLDGMRFRVLKAHARQVLLFQVEKLAEEEKKDSSQKTNE